MKLDRGILIFVFGVMGLAGMVNSLCLLKNTLTSKVYVYQCFLSNDYLADVDTAPIDVPRLTFSNSKIPVVRDRSFTRLSKYLEQLCIFHSGVEEIEDNAFEGLTKLSYLEISGNKLQVVKSAWFKGLANMKSVSFDDNRIKHVDDNLFSILPPLEALDIAINEITCFPTDSFGNFKVKSFQFRYNHLTSICQAQLMKWLDDRHIRYNYMLNDYDTDHKVMKICMNRFAKPQIDEDGLNKCVENTTYEFLPAKENYTVAQVCELLKVTPSPFLNCRY